VKNRNKLRRLSDLIEKGLVGLAINLDALVVNIIVNTIILSPVLWLSGRALVEKGKAKFTDAVGIVILGTVIGTLFGAFFVGIIASIIQLILWLALVKHFFDCGWLKALAISIIAIIIFAAIAIILGLIGFALFQFI
jgi:hypothetical protein